MSASPEALLNDPRLLIVDEPTGGLDPEERVRFRNLLAELSGERIVILSTHIVSDVEAVATRIALIARGRLIGDAAPETMLRDVEGKVWEWVVPSERLTEVRERHRVSGTMRRTDGVHVRIVSDEPPSQTRAPSLLPSKTPISMQWRPPPPEIGGEDLHVLHHVMRADYLERVRRHAFLVTLGFTVIFAYVALPPTIRTTQRSTSRGVAASTTRRGWDAWSRS